MKTVIRSFALVAFAACAAWAGSICPAGNGSRPFPHSPDVNGTGCNVVITINADRTTTVSIKDPQPYENAEDVIVGVLNNSSGNVPSFDLSGNDIFGFEGDGICIYTFVGDSYCSASARAGVDPQDYAGPTTTFVIKDNNTGTVKFNPAVAPNGGSTYFSLEGVPTVNLAVQVAAPSAGGNGPTAGVPALSTYAIGMLGGMLLIYSIWAMRS